MTDRILAVNFSTLIDKTLPGLFAPGCFPQAFSKGFRHNVQGLLKSFRKFVCNPKLCNGELMISTNQKLLTLVLLLLSASLALAQTHRATMRGTVLDPNGAAIPGAQLRLT